jgi:hypothetical protein
MDVPHLRILLQKHHTHSFSIFDQQPNNYATYICFLAPMSVERLRICNGASRAELRSFAELANHVRLCFTLLQILERCCAAVDCGVLQYDSPTRSKLILVADILTRFTCGIPGQWDRFGVIVARTHKLGERLSMRVLD